MPSKNLEIAEDFIKKAFKANPHYSFDDWRIMFNHSVKVKEDAMKIAKKIGADRQIAGLAGLLHDIGKTKRISVDRLEAEHQDFNAQVSAPLLKKLDLTTAQKNKIVSIISYKTNSKEMKAVKDADAIAFFRDKVIHTAFINWATKNNKITSIDKKLNKFYKLNFAASRNMGKNSYQSMLKRWQPKLKRLKQND